MLVFRQLFDQNTWTYTYLLADDETREAVIIDPVDELAERDAKLVQELGFKLKYVLETHVHADHVTAAGELRDRTGAKTVAAAVSGPQCADVRVKEGDTLEFGRFTLAVRETPGHTDGCLTYVLGGADKVMAFTGDALLIRGCGRTDFQQGDPSRLYSSVHNKIFTLPDDALIYPGHDYRGHTVTTVGEEKAFNPRLNLKVNEQQFVGIMRDLKLPNPKLMDIAVPANLACGNRA